MPTIAIIGAGPGLGLSIARVFGHHGFHVALIARTQTTLATLAAQLDQDGITAQGFAADILDRDALRRALHAATERFGQIDVLEFSPAPHAAVPRLEIAGAAEVTVQSIQPQLEFYLHAAITAVGEVLPSMTDRGAGTLLFTTGAGSVTPIPQMGNVNAAVAALRNWAINLHTTLQPMGISTPRTSQSACTSTPAPRRPLPTASPSSTVTPTPPAPAPNTSTHPRPRGHRALSRTPSRRRDSTARDRRRPARTSRDCQRGCRRWLLRYRGGRLYEHRVRSSVAVSSRLTSRPTLSPQVAYPRPAVTNVSRSSSQLLQCWSKERTTRPRRR